MYTLSSLAITGIMCRLRLTLYSRETCAALGSVSSTGALAAPVVSTLQIPVLRLDLFPPTGALAGPGYVVSTLQSPVLHLDVSTLQGSELHLDVSTLQVLGFYCRL